MATRTATDRANLAPAWLQYAPALFLLLWSSGFVFLKLGLAHADPLTFLALRYACVVALVGIAFWWLRPALPATPRIWMHLALVGLFLQAGYFAFTYLSLKLGLSAGAVALITSQQPILVGLLAPLLEPMRIHWTPALLGSLAYLVLCNSLIAITLLLAMIRHGKASRVSALFFLVPPATAAIAFVMLGETIPPLAWPGMLLAVAGIYLVMRQRP